MKKILHELLIGSSVLIEIDNLPKFFEYIHKKRSLFAFWLEYSETMVKITIDKANTILNPEK